MKMIVFFVSKDYLCYRTGNKWVAKDIEEMTKEDKKSMKTAMGDSLYNSFVQKIEKMDKNHKLCLFKSIQGNSLKEKQAIQLCLKLHEDFWIEKKGIPVNYMSEKAKKQVSEITGAYCKQWNHLPMPELREDEKYSFSVYSCQELFKKGESTFYGCKIVMTVSDVGSRVFSIITDKLIIVISDKKEYMVASDQTDLIDEEINEDEKLIIAKF